MEELLLDLARQLRGKYYGKYRGFVTDNQDPQKLGRVRAVVPAVLGDQASAWALPCVPFGGAAAQGLFAVPEVDAQVWIEFEAGDIDHPIWTGTFWQKDSDVPPEAQKSPPTTRLFQTPSGHVLQFDDEEGKERLRILHSSGTEIRVDENGSYSLTDAGGNTVSTDARGGAVAVEDAHGNSVTLDSSGVRVEDASGNRLAMGAAGVTLKGATITLDGTVLLGGQGGVPVLKGTDFLTLFATHVHGTPVGPTSPPLPQGEASALSTSVMTK